MKLFSCPINSIEYEIIMLINDNIPTIVDILTFMSKINTTSENFKIRVSFNFTILPL